MTTFIVWVCLVTLFISFLKTLSTIIDMNRSELYEWLLDNECPFEWNVDEQSSDLKQVVLIFEEND